MGQWSDGRRLRRMVPRPAACLLAAGLAVALVTGCGSGGARPSSGPARTVVQVQHVVQDRWTYARARFRETCGGCHTLADAGTNGRRFNLDHAGEITTQHARYAISEGEPGMPAWRGVLSKREFEELVAYVTTVAKGTPGETNWSWQLALRAAGERWSPTDMKNLEARYAGEAGIAAARTRGSTTTRTGGSGG